MSTPSISTAPDVTSRSRGSRFTRVLLPEPVPPTIAVIAPGSNAQVISLRTDSSAPG